MADLLSQYLSYEERLALPYEDQLAYIEKMRTLAATQVAASELRRYAVIALRDQARNHRAVVERADAQGSDAMPTPIDLLGRAVEEIHGQLYFQKREGINAQRAEGVWSCLLYTSDAADE